MHSTTWTMRGPWFALRGERGGGGRGRGHGGWHRGHRGFGPRGPGDFEMPFRPSRRARRGDVRMAVLALLAEEPMHGYRIIQEITERSDGIWRPSPGSVYPTIAQLQDEGLVRYQEGEAPRVAELTEAGRAYAAEHADELDAVWHAATGRTSDTLAALREELDQARTALFQLARTGSDEQLAQAREVLATARRSLYAILAGDGGQGPGKGPKEAS